MKQQFKLAYRAFRSLGNQPDWKEYDEKLKGICLDASIAAGKTFLLRFQ